MSTSPAPESAAPESDHPRARQRADRRRRPLGHRRRPPPAAGAPQRQLRDPRGAGGERRHLGPLPLPRHPLRLRHAHARLPLPALDRVEVARRRRVDPPLRPRHRLRGRDRPEDPLRPQGRPHRLVERRGPLDRHRRERRRRARDPDLRLPLDVQRLLRLRLGLHPRVPGDRALRRADDPSPVLAREGRRRRQEGGRDRLRRDRGHPGPGARPRRRRGDDAAALAHLRALGPGRRRDRQRAAALDRRAPLLRGRPLEERDHAEPLLQTLPRPPAAGEENDPQRRPRAPAARATTSTPTSSRATTPGTSASASSPTPTSSRSLAEGSAEIVTDTIEGFDESGIELSSGRHLDADIVVTATGLKLQIPRRRRGRDRRRRARAATGLHLQGDDARRRPQLRLHGRLHQRLLDAEGRPRRRVRLPPARPHGSRRLRHLHAADARPLGDRGAAARLQLRLRPARRRRPAEAGLEGALEAAAELPGRPALAALRPGRRRDALRPRGRADQAINSSETAQSRSALAESSA